MAVGNRNRNKGANCVGSCNGETINAILIGRYVTGSRVAGVVIRCARTYRSPLVFALVAGALARVRNSAAIIDC